MSTSLMSNIDESKYNQKIHPQKLLMWLCLGSIIMLFTALLSAYIYKQSSGNWEYVELPFSFVYNTVIIILSSVCFQLSLVNYKKGANVKGRNFIVFTLFLGLFFLLGQYISWKEMMANNIYLIDPRSVSGSFVYILTGLHALNIIGGVIPLIWLNYKALKKAINSASTLGLEITLTYWHFLGALWLYIYLFLLVNQN